jgi:threonylcarbamoyladenosine tRNA methylthiotransferase MtaB
MMRVYLHTFGCKANQYDTETVREALAAAGAGVVSDPRRADAAVVNSCTVTGAAERKMRGLVRRLARLSPGVPTVVMGCAAARDDGTIASLPGVAGVVGGADTSRVLAALGLSAVGQGTGLRTFGRGSRAWLKIQDGCDEHCTFCATTLARGANRSRPASDVLAEAARLAQHHEEIVLTGVHIGTYGRDLADGSSLGTLVEDLVRRIPRVRFRLSSVEATEVDGRIEDLMAGAPDRLAPHLHAPLQSGSDRLLRRMGRHWYTAATYAARVERLAGRLGRFGLGADVMVGFPGETDRDHEATVSLVRDLPFTYLHVFPYSPRPGVAATRLGSPVAARESARRSEELRALATARGSAYAASRAGTLVDVVLLRRGQGRFEGLTEDYLTVHLPADQGPVAPRLSARLAAEGGGLVARAA